ncbi:hypothetical protein GCM10017771_65300 [Streptomyces capitiformicae]|uniref:Uncharacterized protein n=1 Tax=Streptomyces capitiformicae TaxID=2014920 RepID=A0A918ZBQ0_9ACTN|nr:hypothetical protein GCM10017771_65300 [Streptomyces capitiformicae]
MPRSSREACLSGGAVVDTALHPPRTTPEGCGTAGSRPQAAEAKGRGLDARHRLSLPRVPDSAARPASRRATGTRNGEQET